MLTASFTMASLDSSSRRVTLKLLIDKTKEKVLFAEAGKDFIDFLFHLMLLPVGTVISLLKEKGTAGSLIMLHNSIENLSDTYTQSGFNKEILLKPKAPSFSSDSSLLLLKNTLDSSAPKNYYRCGHICYDSCRRYVADRSEAKCPSCGNAMTSSLTLVVPPDSAVKKPSFKVGDYVRELVTYMVMDDLVVKPMSTISCIALLSAFNVQDVGALEEKVVEFGMDEGIKLLQASFQSKTVLTDVFLWKKPGKQSPR